MRNRLQQQQQKQEQPVTFAVQLYPDMSSLTLLQHDDQQDSPTMFSGHLSPDHHSYTAFHHYIAHVCPKDAEAFGVDVWLDAFHTTLGDLELPMSKVPEFQSMISSAFDSLPPVTSLVYTTTELQCTTKNNRLMKDIKGVHFYHLGMAAAAAQLQEVLQPWIAAMQHAAASLGGKCVQKPFSSHQMTIRCHTKRPVERQAFQRVAHAVYCNPISLRVAGIRVQLAASQALEHCGPEHVKTHIGSDGSQVRYPVPIFTSGEAASGLLKGISTAPRPLRAVPCVARAEDAEFAANIEETARLTRLTAEPLMVRAQNGGGFVWQSKLCLLLLLRQSACSCIVMVQTRLELSCRQLFVSSQETNKCRQCGWHEYCTWSRTHEHQRAETLVQSPCQRQRHSHIVACIICSAYKVGVTHMSKAEGIWTWPVNCRSNEGSSSSRLGGVGVGGPGGGV